MFGPIFTGVFLTLVMIGISLRKPNAARIVLGIFFLIMAIVVNGSVTLLNPQLYVDYGRDALIPLYRELCFSIIAINPVIFGLLLIMYETTIGLLMLHKGVYVKVGMVGAILFLIAISPVSLIQIPWLGFALSPAYLLTKHFETTFWGIIRSKFSKTS